MECAGNGRARLRPAAGEPAVAARGRRHRGVDRHAAGRRCCAEAGRRAGRGRRRASPAPTTASSAASSRTTSAACRSRDALRRRGAAGVRDERRAAAAAARRPAAADRARLVRHGPASSGCSGSTVVDEPFRRLPERGRVPDHAGRATSPASRSPASGPRALMVPPGFPDFMTPRARCRRRAGAPLTGGPGRVRRRSAGSRSAPTAARPGRRRAGPADPATATPGDRGRFAWDADAGPAPNLLARATDESGRTSPSSSQWNRRAWPTTSCSAFRSPSSTPDPGGFARLTTSG